ncbi:Type I restriction-modification system, specificity subunit S [Limosilactobacillus reuteri]|uniref:Type I restriction-modification system, specificity subunit S n=1 Tax=Limosilactobacillus reuteri TaxID=1598 RepID=A0A0U5K1D2_LIMRT|nr:Type I restriction-modification system, specificity subunit S [Limosilactobacillus reuteri]
MTPEQLRASILQQAMEGKLVKQDPNDEPASVLLEKIAEEKARLIREKKIKRTKKLPEITDDEKPFAIPDSWEWAYLSDVANITKLAGFEYTKYIKPNLKDNGIPLFKAKNIHNGEINYQFENFITEEQSDNLIRSQLNKKCLLTPYVGSIGNVAIFPGTFKAHLGSNVGKIELLGFNKLSLLEEFVMEYLKSPQGYIQLTKHLKSTAQPSISITALREVILPIPPLVEQKRIVAKIDQIMPLVDEYAEAYDKLKKLDDGFNDKLKQSLLQYAMEGKLVKQDPNDEPASVLLEKITEEKARLIREKKIKRTKKLPEITDDEKPFEIPDSWEWVRLGNLVRFTLGKTPKRSMPEYWESGTIPWVSISDLNNATLKQTKEHITPKAYSEVFGETISTAGTMLMSFKLTIGKVSILGIDAVHNEAIISIYPYIDANKIIRDYLYKVLPFISQHGDFNTAIKGKTLNKKSLSNLLIPLPPLAEQKRIVAKLDQLMSIMH